MDARPLPHDEVDGVVKMNDSAAPGTVINPGNYSRCARCGTIYVPMTYEIQSLPCPGCGA